jgi:hypothetical protein
MIGNIATALFFVALAIFFLLLTVLVGLDWPLTGRATPILFAILFAGLAYRVVWGMRHGE